MDPIKDAFSKARQDIQFLKEQIQTLAHELFDIKKLIEELRVEQRVQITKYIENKTVESQNQTNQQISSTNNSNLTEPLNNSTEDWPYKALKPHIYKISTGNEGVPTNRQTNQQTNQHPNTSSGNVEIERLSNILNSLDTIKKELRIKFKRLTKQEMLVFSAIYQLEEEEFDVDYSLIAKKLALSESSIRDYIQRIIKKGIPIIKTKENNKKIYIKISSDLKKLTSLETLIQLREI